MFENISKSTIFLNDFLFTFLTMQNAREKLAGNSKNNRETLNSLPKNERRKIRESADLPLF